MAKAAIEVIFKRKGSAWAAGLDGEHLYFSDMKAGEVYQQMLVLRPHVRVGFRAKDIGSHVARLCGGPVMWMKTASERAA